MPHTPEPAGRSKKNGRYNDQMTPARLFRFTARDGHNASVNTDAEGAHRTISCLEYVFGGVWAGGTVHPRYQVSDLYMPGHIYS